MESLLDGRHVQVLDTDNIVLLGQMVGQLMKHIVALMLGFRVQLGNIP